MTTWAIPLVAPPTKQNARISLKIFEILPKKIVKPDRSFHELFDDAFV